MSAACSLRRIAVLCALVTLVLVGVRAQDAAEESSANAEVAALKAKLEKALAKGSTCTNSLKETQASVKELEKQLATVPHANKLAAERKQLEAAAQEAKELLAVAEDRLKTAERKLAERVKEVTGLKNKVKAAEQESQSCASGLETSDAKAEEARRQLDQAVAGQKSAEGQLADLKDALKRAQAEAHVAREQYEALAAAWLPHWLEGSRKAAMASVGPAASVAAAYASQGAAAAQELWAIHGAPVVAAGSTIARQKSAALGARVDAVLSSGAAAKHWARVKAIAADSWPRVRGAGVSAAGAVVQGAHQAWNSKAVAAVRPALLAAAAKAKVQAALVQDELERALISVLAKQQSTIALARKPYVTYIVHSLFVIPLVALGMPALGLLLRGGKRRTGGSSATPGSASKRKGKKAGKANQ